MELAEISTLLGGPRLLHMRVTNRMDLVRLGERGVPKGALMHLIDRLDWPIARMAALLPITERTIQRYGNEDRFSPAVSAQILEIAQVVGRGHRAFEDPEQFAAWIEHPNPALAGKRPIELLGSRFGAELVSDELARLEHGIYS